MGDWEVFLTRPSKIDRLDPAIREQIAAWRLAGRSIDEIMEACFAEFPDVPQSAWPVRSGFGMHIQGLDKLAEAVHQSRAIAEALVRQLGDAPESRQARLNVELMHGVVTQLMLAKADQAEDGAPVTFDPEEVMFLSKSLNELAKARRADVATTLQLQKEFAAAHNGRIDEAAREVAKTAKESGLSAERIAELQAKVAGLRIDPAKAAT